MVMTGPAQLEIRYYTTLDGCSCPAWRYRHRRKASSCKHVDRLKAAAALIDSQRRHNEGVTLGSNRSDGRKATERYA